MADDPQPPAGTGHPTDAPDAPDDTVTFTFTHHSTPHEIIFPPDATISEIPPEIDDLLSIPPSHQKLLVPRRGLMKPPFRDPHLPVSAIAGLQVKLLGSRPEAVSALQEAGRFAERRRVARQVVPKARKTGRGAGNVATLGGGGTGEYTFLAVRPLAGLPHPERSLAFLNRLKDDAGIRHAMAKHRLSVGLLTEMEPLSNTQVSADGTSRLLGLNRNKGEVIELRLRTDAHDGYRDYKTVRNTLCHELAHNVHGPHDRAFWDFCGLIERDVRAGGGNALGGGEEVGGGPPGPGEVHDEGGWTGGSYVLGRAEGQGQGGQGLSRREVMRKAAEERAKRAGEGGGAGAGRS